MKKWIPFCLGVLAVVVASLSPVSVAPSPAQEAHAFSDALWHAVTYFFLTLLALYAVSERGHRAYIFATVSVVTLGAGIELAQAFVPYRTASVADAGANAVGALGAYATSIYKK